MGSTVLQGQQLLSVTVWNAKITYMCLVSEMLNFGRSKIVTNEEKIIRGRC